MAATMDSNMGIQLFNKRPRDTFTETDVSNYTTRFFLACMENLNLLTGASELTKEEWFNIIDAAILFRTIIPGNSKYGESLEPKSAIMDDGPDVVVQVEGVTVTGSAPVRWVIHDLISDYYRLESRINITGSDILAGFDAVKVSTTLKNLKLKYDELNVQRLIGHLYTICDMIESDMGDEEAAARFAETLGCANFDPEQYSRSLLKEPDFYLKHTRFKVNPNTALIPGGIVPFLVPYSTIKAFETQTAMISWNPITSTVVELDAPNIEVQRIVGSSGGVAMDMLPYNVEDRHKKYTCAGEVIYVGHVMPNGQTSGKFDPRDTDVKVFSVSSNSMVTYTVDSMLDGCWLLFDATGEPSEFVKKSVADLGGPSSQHPYHAGPVNLNGGADHVRTLASRLEKSVPQSRSETASVYPFTRITVKDGVYSTSVAKVLGDASLSAIPRENFNSVARRIVSALGPEIRNDVATFGILDRDIFNASQGSETEDITAFARGVGNNGTLSFSGIAANSFKGPIPPGAGPYEYLVELSSNRDAYTQGEYGRKASRALELLNKIYSAVSQYLGESKAFSVNRVPRFSATKSSLASFYYVLSENDWEFLTDGDEVIYFGKRSASRQASAEQRGKVVRGDGGALKLRAIANSALAISLAYAAIDVEAPSIRKRKRTNASAAETTEISLSSMTSAKKTKSKKSSTPSKRTKGKQASASEAVDSEAMDLEGPFIDESHVTTPGGEMPVDLSLRLATLDQAGGGLLPALVWALCLVEFSYPAFKKLTSAGIPLPFVFAACSKLVVEVKKTLFLKRTRKDEDELVKGGGIQLAIFDPTAHKQAMATEQIDIRLRHRNVMNIATDVTGIPSHTTAYYSGRNRILFDSMEQYESAELGEGEPDTLVVPVFAGEYPGTQSTSKPFFLVDPTTTEECPPMSHSGQKRYSALLMKHLTKKPVSNGHCLFNDLDSAQRAQPAYWFTGSFWQTNLELKKDIFYKGQIMPNQRAHVQGANLGYNGELVLANNLISNVDLV